MSCISKDKKLKSADFFVRGSGLSVGQSPAIKRWVQIQADGRSKDRHTIFIVNQLGGIGGGYKNSMFGPTADGVHLPRGRIVSKLYCNAGGYNCCNCISTPACSTKTGRGECFGPNPSPSQDIQPTSGTAYVIETAPKHYHIIGSKDAIFSAWFACGQQQCWQPSGSTPPPPGRRVFPMSCGAIEISALWCQRSYPNSIFWSTHPGNSIHGIVMVC